MEFHKPGPNKRVCAFFIDSIVGQGKIGTGSGFCCGLMSEV